MALIVLGEYQCPCKSCVHEKLIYVVIDSFRGKHNLRGRNQRCTGLWFDKVTVICLRAICLLLSCLH